jgi:hypothetical protein
MDCLRSFNFQVNSNDTLSGGNVKTWTTGGGEHYWSANAGTASTYNISGYKNINVYGVDIIGTVQTLTGAGVGGVIVNDWIVDVLISGQPPLIGANVTTSPNYYSISNTTPFNRIFPLGKFTSSVRLGDPYESVQFIQLGQTYAQGVGYQTSGTVNLYFRYNVIVYYKFEGE